MNKLAEFGIIVPISNSGVRLMRKINSFVLVLAGFTLGLTVAYSPQIHATASGLLGSNVKKVLNVKVDNDSIGNGAVINGTTYVPLRPVANAMGMEVTSVSSTEVTLSSSKDAGGNGIQNDVSTITSDPVLEAMKEKEEKISKINNQISALKIKIKNLQATVGSASSESVNRIKLIIEKYEQALPNQPELQPQLDGYKNQLQQINDEAAAAQKEIDVLQPQLEDLESELTKLQP